MSERLVHEADSWRVVKRREARYLRKPSISNNGIVSLFESRCIVNSIVLGLRSLCGRTKEQGIVRYLDKDNTVRLWRAKDERMITNETVGQRKPKTITCDTDRIVQWMEAWLS